MNDARLVLKGAVTEAARTNVPEKGRPPRMPWISAGTMRLIAERGALIKAGDRAGVKSMDPEIR